MKLSLMNVARVHTGTDEQMSFEVPPFSRFVYRELVKKAQPKDRFDVTVSISERKRSTGEYSQNHHLNGHVQQIAMYTGNDFADVKLYIKRQAFCMGLPFLRNKRGEPVLSMNDRQPLPISEHDMTSEQCGWCIDAAHILASEFGIVLVEE